MEGIIDIIVKNIFLYPVGKRGSRKVGPLFQVSVELDEDFLISGLYIFPQRYLYY